MRIFAGDPKGHRDIVGYGAIRDGHCAVQAQEKLCVSVIISCQPKCEHLAIDSIFFFWLLTIGIHLGFKRKVCLQYGVYISKSTFRIVILINQGSGISQLKKRLKVSAMLSNTEYLHAATLCATSS